MVLSRWEPFEVCLNFPDFTRTQFHEPQAAESEALCFKRAEDCPVFLSKAIDIEIV